MYSGDESAHRLFPVDQYPEETGERAAREVAERDPGHLVMIVEEEGSEVDEPGLVREWRSDQPSP